MDTQEVREAEATPAESMEEPNDATEEAAAAEEAEVPEVLVEIDAEAIAKERDELRDQLLRLRADFDNYRKRVAREEARLRRTAAESLVRDLLPVCDHLELALRHAEGTTDGLFEGVEMVFRQFCEVLSRHGVEPIPALGERFDPNVHEAVLQRPADDVPADVVVDEFQRGYRMGDQVLRPSKVVVSSGPPEDAGTLADEGADAVDQDVS